MSIRPAPDTMAYLTGLLPVAQGVAVHTALSTHADAMKAQGDPRSRGQIMADALVTRVTGQAQAEGVDAEVQLVITDRALLGGAGGRQEPAYLAGYGPIPAELGRRIVQAADRAWIRRLFTDPVTGQLAAMDARRRYFTAGHRQFFVIRDQTCRTPWCDAPVRHGDHVVPVQDGGETTRANGQGLCEACNYAKQATGWRARSGPSRRRVQTTTPTGHRYNSEPPPLPGHHPPHHTRPRAPVTVLEDRFRQVLTGAA